MDNLSIYKKLDIPRVYETGNLTGPWSRCLVVTYTFLNSLSLFAMHTDLNWSVGDDGAIKRQFNGGLMVTFILLAVLKISIA